MSRVLIIIIILIAVCTALFLYEKSAKKIAEPVVLSENLQKYSSPSFNPDIRVHLVASQQVQIQIKTAYEIHSVGNQKRISSGKKLTKTIIQRLGNKIKIGKMQYDSEGIEISVKKSPGIWINKSFYRGKIRIFGKSRGRIEVVNVVPMQNYIASVTDSEMPGHFPEEARAAQAIIARTYALYQMKNVNKKSHYDLFSSTRSQKYLGYQYLNRRGRLLAGESPSSRKIAEQTAGMVCTHKGALFCTYYSAVCGGKSDEGKTVFSDAAPPVKSVVCNWCKDARYYQWTAQMSRESFNSAILRYLKKKKTALKTVKSVKSSNSLNQFSVSDGKESVVIQTREIKPYLSSAQLLSPKFTIKLGSQKAEFKGFGHGHCVGFCQWGSRGLAKSGKTMEEILQYYYPGSNLVNLSMKTELAGHN